MALWRPVRFERKQVVNTFGDGINTAVPPFDIIDSESPYLRNVGSQDYPALSVRYGRTFYNSTMLTIVTPNGLGERSSSDLHVLDGNMWRYWVSATTSFVNLSSSLSSTEGNIQEFNTGAYRYSLMMNSTQLRYWDGATTSSTSYTLGDASTPYTKLFTIHKGRIFAAKNATVYYSALNLINDWTTPNNSGNITLTKSKGSITGICEYNNHVIVFTEFGMHELFGDSPTNFQLVDIEGNVGCISDRSITKVNNKLYWLAQDGVYEYQGATPIKVSLPVTKYIELINYANRTKTVSGSVDALLYIAIPYNDTSNNLLLVYDSKLNKWYIETGNFVDFVTIQNVLYGLDSTGGIKNMRDITATNDNGTAISWEYISKPFKEGTQKLAISDISLIYNAVTGGTLNVSYSTSATSTSAFTSLAVSTDLTLNSSEQNTLLNIPTTDLNDENWYRFKFDGTGQCKIHYLEKNYRVKRR